MRLVLASLSVMGMFQSYPVNFPITGAAVLDLSIFLLQKAPSIRLSSVPDRQKLFFSRKKIEAPEKRVRYYNTNQCKEERKNGREDGI